MRQLKTHYNVFTNKELAEILEISESTISKWIQRNSIPKRYIKILESSNIVQNGDNNIQVNQNNGTVNINHNKDDLCELISKLSDKKREYFYHLIKAEILKDEL